MPSLNPFVIPLVIYPRCLFISDDLVNVLTVCNNERVAVTIEVKILAFTRDGGVVLTTPRFFCGFDTISLKLIFIPKYIDLRTFVVKISRVTFTYFAHRFDCSGQV